MWVAIYSLLPMPDKRQRSIGKLWEFDGQADGFDVPGLARIWAGWVPTASGV